MAEKIIGSGFSRLMVGAGEVVVGSGFIGKLGYCRVSTADQTGALEGQMDRIRAYGVDSLWWDVLSGSSSKRPSYVRMLESVKAGLVSEIVCTRVDRLGRNSRELLEIVEVLNDNDVRLTLTEQRDVVITGTTGKLIYSMMAVVAQFERDMLMDRIRVGVEHRKDKGLVDKIVFGYKANLDGKIVLDEGLYAAGMSKAGIGRWMIELALEGKFKREILEEVKEKTGVQVFSVQGLGDWFRHCQLVGDISFKRGKEVELIVGNHMGLMNRDESKRIDELLKSRKSSGKSLAAGLALNPLKSKIQCAECGASFTIDTVSFNGKKYVYFAHSKSKVGFKCVNRVRIKEEKMYEKVKDYFSEKMWTDIFNAEEIVNESGEYNARIEGLERKLAVYVGLEADSIRNEAISKIEAEIEKVKEAGEVMGSYKVAIDSWNELEANWLAERDNASNVEMCRLVEKIVVGVDRVKIVAVDLKRGCGVS